MEGEFINLRFNHRGKFSHAQYVGGVHTTVMGVDPDKFSYTVLMEHVKDDLRYREIGGIYVSSSDNGGWKLMSNDADLSEMVIGVKCGDTLDFFVDNVVDHAIEPLEQMQPHVVIRPRKNVFTATKEVKRKFMTTHQLQQLQKNKKSAGPNSPRKSARLQNPQVNDETVINLKFDELNSPRKSARLRNPQLNGATVSLKFDEVTSVRKSSGLKSTELNDAPLNLKSTDFKSQPKTGAKKIESK